MPPRASTQERSLRSFESAFPRWLCNTISDRTGWSGPARIKGGGGLADHSLDVRDPVPDEFEQAKPALEEDRALLGTEAVAGDAGRGARWHVAILPEARAEARGVLYRRGGRLFLLPWGRVSAAHAAEVGEAEGVQTVVFDLALVGRPRARCRLDADPGEAARALGQAIERGLGRSRCSASLRAVALEGYATRSYPDVESFEADAPHELQRSA
jgi:hypothetical protein